MATFLLQDVAEAGRSIAPSAALKITYSTFSDPIHSRIHDVLETEQRWDQIGVRPRPGSIMHWLSPARSWARLLNGMWRFGVRVWTCEKLNFRLEFRSLFDALRCQGIYGSDIHILDAPHRSQSSSADGGTSFSTHRYSAHG